MHWTQECGSPRFERSGSELLERGDNMTTDVNLETWDTGLDASRGRILKTLARGGILIAHATGARMVAAWTLVPAPRDPVVHLGTAHARARQHLARLTAHDPGREVASAMTNELFDRLTDGQPAPLTAPAGVGRYTYTPPGFSASCSTMRSIAGTDRPMSRGAATARPSAD